jgi:hypothetical protein
MHRPNAHQKVGPTATIRTSEMSEAGTTQKCRRVRPMSAIEGNPDIRRRCAEGPGLTLMHRANLWTVYGFWASANGGFAGFLRDRRGLNCT